MAKFELNLAERKAATELCDAAKLLLGLKSIVSETYCFTSTSIGVKVEIELKLNNNTVVRKDITDYESW